MKKTHTRLILILSLVLIWNCVFAGTFSWDKTTLNNEGDAIYRACDADMLVSKLESGDKAYSAAYLGQDCLVAGRVTEISYFSMTISSGTGTEIKVSADKKQASQIAVGDTIRAYGVLSADSKNRLRMNAGHLKKASSDALTDDYYVYSDDPSEDIGYKDSEGTLRTLADGRVSFLVPSKWMACLCDDETAAGIFNLNGPDKGECYFLNALTGTKNVECFVIFDLDYEDFLYDSDKDKTFAIERTVVSNICKDERDLIRKALFPVQASKNHTGINADYYVASYDNDYSVEFVFVPGSDHMCVMMYIHKSDILARNDVLYLIRTLTYK